MNQRKKNILICAKYIYKRSSHTNCRIFRIEPMAFHRLEKFKKFETNTDHGLIKRFQKSKFSDFFEDCRHI